ncbi:MAG TPA: SDR family oxidoreductase [Dehalococcoidia bacterium]|nr:SDR family oxidoreductase [Dehalococcoidia bacterium]
MDGLNGKIALITGAGSGIGAATAGRLADSGVNGLILIDRDGAAVDAIAGRLEREDLRVLARATDVADESGWLAIEDEVRDVFGRLDLTVANAGIAHGEPLIDHGFDAWRRVIAVNLDGVFLTLRAALRLIRGGGQGGAVVVVSSASAVKAEPGIAAYGASKAGALQLARVAAKEGAPDRIRVNAILPGGVATPIWKATPFFQQMVVESGSEAAAFAHMATRATPLGRFATAEEVAGQIAFLLSDLAATITGAALLTDGGYTL